MDYLETLLQSKKNQVNSQSFYSCCSANHDVIVAAIKRAKQTSTPLLIEATANQVNQFGGYTGLDPLAFKQYVLNIANDEGLVSDQIIFGGDHLGPLVWSDEDELSAMAKAEKLVRAYVRAGFQKIHIDTSMRLASDDPNEVFPVEICAKRGAQLCKACEEEYQKLLRIDSNIKPPIYVIGSEVPVPGGEVGNNPSDKISSVEDCKKTIATYKSIFDAYGLSEAFQRVLAIVVEMGVEFSEFSISEYDSKRFEEMARYGTSLAIGFEAHSTDYQTRKGLSEMCSDGAIFLKVGPALTFAARSALFKLELIERELLPYEKCSHYRSVLDKIMKEDPSKWVSYYRGSEQEKAFARAFSFSDRCRYYLSDNAVQEAHDKLLANLSSFTLPLCLLLQYFPNQYRKIREGILGNLPEEILYDSIGEVIDDYLAATHNNGVD